ncbi:MAG: N-acetyltransferase [Clostridia bacterium]|nr:N-acetyltransferase [Clostridia bacterium]
MTITNRPYKLLSDFIDVHEFLSKTYTIKELNSMMIPQFFEYAHTHPAFNHKLTHKMTIWENDNQIVAFCGYETDVGEAYLVAEKNYYNLLPEMLLQAEKELAIESSGKLELSVWIIDSQQTHAKLLEDNGYKKIHAEPVKIFNYENNFINITLPEGFKCVTLNEAKDIRKLHRCLHLGFNHDGEPDDDIECRKYMQSGKHYRFDLSRIIIAPNGDYACYAGMWLDELNHYAYLEPLCTVPEYRRMGLASYVLTEAMKATKQLGALYCFGGIPEFYTAIGFKTICNRELWKKVWQ